MAQPLATAPSGHTVYRTVSLRPLNPRSTLSWTPMSAPGPRA